MSESGERPVSIARELWWVLLLTFALYAPSLGHEFVQDGTLLAKLANPEDRPAAVIGDLRSPAFYFEQHYWAGTNTYDGLYRPLTVLSFALTFHLVSEPLFSPEREATPHRLFNILLQLVAVVLVWLLCRDLGLSTAVARFAALLFGVHAIHAEVLLTVVGRSELFAFVFGAGALLLFGRGGALPRVLSAVLLFLALCSKESALAWIALIPFYELARSWRQGPRPRRWLLAFVIVVVPPLLAWFVLRNHALADMTHMPREIGNLKNPLAHVDYLTRCLTGIKVWGYGLYKCLIPYPLCSIYGIGAFSLVDSVADVGFLAALVAILAVFCFGVVFAFVRRYSVLFLASAVFLGFSFLASNLTVATGTIFGERLYYTPSLGICLLLGYAARLRSPLQAILILYIALNCVVVLDRTPKYSDSETLALHDLTVQPGSADLQDMAAALKWQQVPRDEAGAMRHVDAAIRIYPEYTRALLKRASYHARRDERKEAAAFYARACNSPHSRIGYRMEAQRGFARLLYPPESTELSTLLRDARTHADSAGVWAAAIDRAMQTPDFPRNRLDELLGEATRRFPRDQLLRLYAGVFAGNDGISDAAEARAILDSLSPGLWYLRPADLWTLRFLLARFLAAACYAKLADWDNAENVFDQLLRDPELPENLRPRVEQARTQILGSRAGR